MLRRTNWRQSGISKTVPDKECGCIGIGYSEEIVFQQDLLLLTWGRLEGEARRCVLGTWRFARMGGSIAAQLVILAGGPSLVVELGK